MTRKRGAALVAVEPSPTTDAESCARNRQLLEGFARAWQAHDIDAVMACMSDDVIYDASVGDGPGTRYHGRDAVREGVVAMLAFDAVSAMHVDTLCVHSDFAVVSWRYEFVARHGAANAVRGVDVMRFRDGHIVLKDAFRKAHR